MGWLLLLLLLRLWLLLLLLRLRLSVLLLLRLLLVMWLLLLVLLLLLLVLLLLLLLLMLLLGLLGSLLCLHALHHLSLLRRHARLVHRESLHATRHHVVIRSEVLRSDATGHHLAVRSTWKLLWISGHWNHGMLAIIQWADHVDTRESVRLHFGNWHLMLEKNMAKLNPGQSRIALTLPIRWHIGHSRVLHHASRHSLHHLRVRARVKASLRWHVGELLLLIEHHLLIRLAPRLLRLLLLLLLLLGLSIGIEAIAAGVHLGRIILKRALAGLLLKNGPLGTRALQGMDDVVVGFRNVYTWTAVDVETHETAQFELRGYSMQLKLVGRRDGCSCSERSLALRWFVVGSQ